VHSSIIRFLPPALLLLAGCDGEPAETPVDRHTGAGPAFHVVGKLQSSKLNEASGIQALPGDRFVVHNDEGEKLYFTDAVGRDLGSAKIGNAKSRDWEDIARVPGAEETLLVIGDVGDNQRGRKRTSLYFVPEPAAGEVPRELDVRHRLRLSYPDGPRDVEALAYDPGAGDLLLLSKRDQPPRLYRVPLDLALWKDEIEAEYLGEIRPLRPPTRRDILLNPGRGLWVSQPTGMDISPDGHMAAVITYRSLYLYTRTEGESWLEAFQREPAEIVGPPGTHDEAVSFSLDGGSVYVTTEGRPAPLYRLDLPARLP